MERGVRLFFASAGRMGRCSFVVAAVVLLALFAAYEWAVRGAAHLATGWLVHLILFTAAASVLSKRLHDRGRSGWWSALILLAFALAWPRPAGPVGWLAAGGLIWAAMELVVLPGQRTFNRFGPPLG